MAAALPAVAAAGGAIAELVADGRGTLLVPPGDAGAMGSALAELAADPVRRRDMGAHARRRVENAFGIERTAAALEQLYGELLPAPAGGG
jgi:glycosyltransferase involved in cell wall biosynthesis